MTIRNNHHDWGKIPVWLRVGLAVVQLAAGSWGLAQSSWLFPDSDRYVQAAYNLKHHGELYARPWPQVPPHGQAMQEFTIRPPGYPLLVLALGASNVAKMPLWLLLVQNLLGITNVMVILSWWSGRVQSTVSDWVWVSVLLLFPAQVIYANTVMSEVLLQTLLLGLMVSGWRFL